MLLICSMASCSASIEPVQLMAMVARGRMPTDRPVTVVFSNRQAVVLT